MPLAAKRDLFPRARRAIEGNERIIYDVAADCGQIVGNVARWIAEETAAYSHLLVELALAAGSHSRAGRFQ